MIGVYLPVSLSSYYIPTMVVAVSCLGVPLESFMWAGEATWEQLACLISWLHQQKDHVFLEARLKLIKTEPLPQCAWDSEQKQARLTPPQAHSLQPRRKSAASEQDLLEGEVPRRPTSITQWPNSWENYPALQGLVLGGFLDALVFAGCLAPAGACSHPDYPRLLFITRPRSPGGVNACYASVVQGMMIEDDT